MYFGTVSGSIRPPSCLPSVMRITILDRDFALSRRMYARFRASPMAVPEPLIVQLLPHESWFSCDRRPSSSTSASKAFSIRT